jgi:C4-dicarboxylate-binding protein DctP
MSRVLRAAGYQGAASVHTRALGVLAEALDAETGGRIRLAVTPDVTAAGRPATDLFAMTEGDELDICYFASSYLARRVPDLAVFDLPFAMPPRDALQDRLDGAPGRVLADAVAAMTGFRLLAYWDNGMRHFTSRDRAIVAPADCDGLVIRTMDSALHQATFAALGFRPLYIDVKDYPAAVRDGVVDAQENPLTNTVNFGVHQTHRHLTLSGHFTGVTLVLGNAARLGALTDADAAALDRAMRAATTAQRRFAAEEDARCLSLIEAAGVAVVGPDAFDRPAFVAATSTVTQDAARAIAPDVVAAFR